MDVAERDAGTDERGNADRSGDRLHLRRVGRLACGDAGDNHAIDEKELGGLGCFDEADVGRERVGRVLLLDVGEDANAVRADGPAVAKQRPALDSMIPSSAT